MSNAFKFLHASDLQLDRPMQGLSDIPVHLKQPLADAPYAAAEQLFNLAINERVDFVLLAGNVVNLDLGGPRCIAFLLRQFERLASHSIQVYWCGGPTDQLEHWPQSIDLPSNVKVFCSSMVESISHHRGEKVIATILGAAFNTSTRNAGNFHIEKEAPFGIAFSNGDLDISEIEPQHIKYWAWGGRRRHSIIQGKGTTLVYPGTTQSRKPSEIGKHGCTLVRVDTEGRLSAQECDLSVVDWCTQEISVPEKSTLDDLKDCLGEIALKISPKQNHCWQLVNWQISTEGLFDPQLRNRHFQKVLVDWLRQEFGENSNRLWTVSLEIEPPRSLPKEWYEEETLLGDYLRSVGRFQADPSLRLPLDISDTPLSEQDTTAELTSLAHDNRESLLQQATLLGVELLLPDDSNSIQV